MLETGKEYTVKELYDIYGINWKNKLGLSKVPIIKNKLEIFCFKDFDILTQQIYKRIYSFINQYNLNTSIRVSACGSRILGTWKTKEEAEKLYKQYNMHKIKYSDYDFVTDAKVLPTNKEIEQFLGENIKVDGHRIQDMQNITFRAVPID